MTNRTVTFRPAGMHSREAVAGSPVCWSESLRRRIRQDGVATLGISSQTLAEDHLRRDERAVAADLGTYFHDEMSLINHALYTWLIEILASRDPREGHGGTRMHAERTIAAMSSFDAGGGDLVTFVDAAGRGQAGKAADAMELMRVRTAAVHDMLVYWIQELLTDVARCHGDEAVRDIVVATFDSLWGPRYDRWPQMAPLERLQLSVEGMRGHLSGPRHRGDVGVIEEQDRYIMVLDPCGSCGVLRRGDPDSGRPPARPAGTTRPHDWSAGRAGMGWYAVHSAIVMEWLPMQRGAPPFRPLSGCDQEGPCRWYVYKDPEAAVPGGGEPRAPGSSTAPGRSGVEPERQRGDER